MTRISADLSKWTNAPADIELRAGDKRVIPKRPNFVMISGEVYNATAISYLRGREADGTWGRPEDPRNRLTRRAFSYCARTVRWSAAGIILSVVCGRGAIFFPPACSPNNSIVVPEKISSGSMFCSNLMTWAQLASSTASVGGTVCLADALSFKAALLLKAADQHSSRHRLLDHVDHLLDGGSTRDTEKHYFAASQVSLAAIWSKGSRRRVIGYGVWT